MSARPHADVPPPRVEIRRDDPYDTTGCGCALLLFLVTFAAFLLEYFL